MNPLFIVSVLFIAALGAILVGVSYNIALKKKDYKGEGNVAAKPIIIPFVIIGLAMLLAILLISFFYN